MSETPRPRRRKRAWVVALAVAMIACEVVLQWPRAREPIRISPQTTVVKGPRNADGTIDYLAVLNSACTKGVTRQNNAGPLLLGALGPEGDKYWQWYYSTAVQALGVEDPPRPKACYTPWAAWLHDHQVAASQPTAGAWSEETVTGLPLLGTLLTQLQSGDRVPLLRAWLADNQPALDQIVAATRMPRYYLPLFAPDDEPQVAGAHQMPMMAFRDTAHALGVRAMLKLRAGKVEAAWQDILAIHRLARLTSQGPTLTQQLVANAIESWAIDAGTIVATRGHLSARAARSMLRDLLDLPPPCDMVSAIDRYDRFMALDLVMSLYRGGQLEGKKLDSGDWDWNELLLELNGWYDRAVDVMRIERLRDRKRADQALQADLQAEFDRVSGKVRTVLVGLGGRLTRKARTRTLGALLMSMLMPSALATSQVRDATETMMDMEKTAFALAAFRAEHGRWPKALSELTPGYLSAVPIDRFGEGPLIYRPTPRGYVLYSVGPNQQDDGGIMSQMAKEGDLVVTVK